MSTTDRLKGKPGTVNATIILRSGMYFDYLNPQPEMINIEDIAWALANTCRFGGQCLHFYSVAQHSVLVSENVSQSNKMNALMHDAAEAYVGDIVSPLKQLIPEFKTIENRVEEVIAYKFGLTIPWSCEIKHCDLRLLRTEQRDLTSQPTHNWNGLDAYVPLRDRIIPLMPSDAANLFLTRYSYLKGL